MKKVICLFILILPFSALADLDKNWKRDAIKAAKEVPKKYALHINDAAWKYDIPPSLIAAIIVVESLGNPKAVSASGAKCLMQTMDFIGKEVGMPGNSCDPRKSIMRGTAYLARIRDHYGCDWPEETLVAYNNGQKHAKKMSEKEITNHLYLKKINFVLKYI